MHYTEVLFLLIVKSQKEYEVSLELLYLIHRYVGMLCVADISQLNNSSKNLIELANNLLDFLPFF